MCELAISEILVKPQEHPLIFVVRSLVGLLQQPAFSGILPKTARALTEPVHPPSIVLQPIV